MAACCGVPGCRNKAGEGVRLYKIPQDPVNVSSLKEQLQISSKTWKPGKHDRICNQHFENGLPSWLCPNSEYLQVENSADVSGNTSAMCSNQSDGTEEFFEDGDHPSTTIYRVDAHSVNLCQSLYKLTLSEHQFCDVTLKLNTVKKEYKAHSPVLAICSSFFKSILDKPEHQHVKNVVILLPDFIQPEGLEPILLFIYTGDLGINKKNVSAIYQVAVLFELSAAMALCQKFVEINKLSQSLLNIQPTAKSCMSLPDDPPKKEEELSTDCERSKDDGEIQEDEIKEECEYSETREDSFNLKNSSSDSYRTKVSGKNQKNKNGESYESEDDDDDDDDVNFSDTDNGIKFSEKSYGVETNQKDSDLNSPSEIKISETLSPTNLQEISSEAVPVRRSLRKHAGQKRKSQLLALAPIKKCPAKRKLTKTRMKKVKLKREVRSHNRKVKCEEDSSPQVADTILSKIDQTLKFTDPAKYIAELIDKNTDMLNEHGSNSHGGGVQVITRGKITYIFPDGVDVSLPSVSEPQAVSVPSALPPDAKVNAEGLPYEKIVDPLTCSECNITFTSMSLRDEHVESKHQGQSSSLKQVMFQCLSCSFSTDFLRNMWFHCHWKHSYPLPDTLRQYCCGLCDYRAPAQGNIEVHIRRVHTQERPLMCDVCGQFFKSLDTLRGHRFYRHQDIYPFQCNVCEKQFKRRHKLDVHMRIHMGYKPFSCPECQYATYTKFNLKDHMRKRHLKELDASNQ